MGAGFAAQLLFFSICFSPSGCSCLENEVFLWWRSPPPILPSQQIQGPGSQWWVHHHFTFYFFLLFSLQRLTMGYFSRMKTPGKEFGWKQAEHWITTCWEMGYAVDLPLSFHRFRPRPSIEDNMIMLQRKGEIGKSVLISEHCLIVLM